MTIDVRARSFIFCFLLCRFDNSMLASAGTIPNIDKFVHKGFGYFTNSKYVLQQTNTNQDLCIDLCHETAGCYGLSYNAATGACQLHAVSVDSFYFAKALTANSQYIVMTRQMQLQETCPDSKWQYLSSSNKCYGYFNTTWLDFDDAEIECNKYGYGGHLMQPSTNEEATLAGALNPNFGNYFGIVWQDSPTSYYYFLDGRVAVWPSAVTWWKANHTFPGRSSDKNCVCKSNGRNAPWFQYWTTGGELYPYICELPVVHG